MAQIAQGKGKAPDAVHARQEDARPTRYGNPTAVKRPTRVAQTRTPPCVHLRKRKTAGEPQEARGQKKAAACPTSCRRSFARCVERPPDSDGWCHEIKFDGYRVQLRVAKGEAALYTRKGLDWTDKFEAIAKEAASLGMC